MLILIFCNYPFKHHFSRQKRHYHVHKCQLEMWKNLGSFLISFPSLGMKRFQRSKLNQASANIERTSSKSNKILCLTWLKPAQILCWLSFDLNESFNQIQHEFSLAEIHLRPRDKRAPSTMSKFVKNNRTKQILQCSNHFSNKVPKLNINTRRHSN